ncbi:hypothetical protein ACIBCA_16710 [Kitasatospora sp. NPDC051170]|uniref:hypothetical protein n=1 Tax=Kitasatospora sp. NPDC051170 TaxID=3364056 RepID=UPI0037AB01C1
MPLLAVAALAVVAAGPGVAPLAHERALLASATSWDQLMNLQDRMNETAYALQKSPGQTRDRGIASVVASPEDKHLTVHWRGALTPAARTIIARSPVAVKVEPAGHTEQELNEASARVRPIAESAGIPYTDISLDQGTGGLAISVSGTEADAQRLRQLTEPLGVPVSVTPGGKAALALSEPSRGSDPSAGGAQMVAPNAVCTTGFAGKIQNQPVMLTADHCFPPGIIDERKSTEQGADGTPFGKRVGRPIPSPNGLPYDVNALSPMSGTVFEPKVWTGPAVYPGGPGQQKVWVNAAAQPQLGNWVCNTAAKSGTTCNIKIVDYKLDYKAKTLDGNGQEVELRYGGAFGGRKKTSNDPRVAQNSATPDLNPYAGRRGDSGGPIVMASNSARLSADHGTIDSTVTAAGIVSAGPANEASTKDCVGSSFCFTTIYFVPMRQVLEAMGATITVASPYFPDLQTDVKPGDLYTNAAQPVYPEDYDRVAIVAENGAAVAVNPADHRLIGTDTDRPGAAWQILPDVMGGYVLRNKDTYYSLHGTIRDPISFTPVAAYDPSLNLYVIHLGQNCLQVTEGFRWMFPPHKMLVSGVATISPCRDGDRSQRFSIVPVSGGDGVGASDPSPTDGTLTVPYEVAGAPDASMSAAASFLAKTHDRYAPSGLGVPQSYTGGHFAPGTEFGPDGYQSSFTYDNSVMIAALLQGKNRDVARATRLGDSLLYAQAHDKVPDGRIRASYLPNPFVTANGSPYVGGFSVYTGNMAWAGMAFSRLYQQTGEQRFRDGALKVAEWIQTNAADTRGLGGYTGGWVDTGGTGDAMVRREWKATEHNIDVGAFFAMLAQITGDPTWKARSDNAFAFVRGMQADDGRLWTGTGTDGVTQNRDSVPEDVQTWSYLATLDPVFSRSVDWAEANLAASDGPYRGVSFAKADTSKVWLEGTAHLLAAYHARGAEGDPQKAAVLQDTLAKIQAGAPTGDGQGIVAASSDGLATGEGDIYYASLHTGATAWYLLAGQGGNPFRL